MEKKEKPRLAEVLGVGMREKIRIVYGGYSTDWFSLDQGNSLADLPCKEIVWAINHPESIIRAPRLTEAELAICKTVGAKWVSRDNEEVWARLWNAKPEFELDGLHYRSDEAFLLALVDGNMFPSVRPGDCICVEEAGCK